MNKNATDGADEIRRYTLAGKITVGMMSKIFDFLRHYVDDGNQPETVPQIPKATILNVVSQDIEQATKEGIISELTDVLKQAIVIHSKKIKQADTIALEMHIWKTLIESVSPNPSDDIKDIEAKVGQIADFSQPKALQESPVASKATKKPEPTRAQKNQIILNEFRRFFNDLIAGINMGLVSQPEADDRLKQYIARLRKSGLDYEAMIGVVDEIEKAVQSGQAPADQAERFIEKLESLFELPAMTTEGLQAMVPDPQQKITAKPEDIERMTNQALDTLTPLKQQLEAAKQGGNPGAIQSAQSAYDAQMVKVKKQIQDFRGFTQEVDRSGRPINHIKASTLATFKRMMKFGL